MPVKRLIVRRATLLNRFRPQPAFFYSLILALAGLSIAYSFSPDLGFGNSLRLTWSSANASPLQGGCTVNCNATAPTTADINQGIDFTATAVTGGCVGSPTFQWDFGDNQSSTQQNPSHSYVTGGIYNWRLTVESFAPVTMANISTVSGGFGEGDSALDVSFARLLAVTRDPAGRGIYLVHASHSSDRFFSVIQFLNTGTTTATIGGISVAPRTVRRIAGGGTQAGENLSGLVLDFGTLTGVVTNPSGELLYFTDLTERRIRVINVANTPVAVAGSPLDPGKVRTFANPMNMGQQVFGEFLLGLAYHAPSNDLIVADATTGIWKVYRAHQNGTADVLAGTGEVTRTDHVFEIGQGTATPLLDPRGVAVESTGDILILDSGHARIVRVAANGVTRLVAQFSQGRGSDFAYAIGIGLSGSTIYSANGNEQQILRASASPTVLTGQFQQACNYVVSSCGDGGPAAAAFLGLPTSTSELPVIGLQGDPSGLYILDQANGQRSRVRFVNTSASGVTLAGVTIPAGGIATIAGRGAEWPFDGGKATGASLKFPIAVASDANRNLFIADTQNHRIRFVNRSGATVNLFQGTPAAQIVPPGAIATVNYLGGAGAGQTAPAHRAILEHPQGLTVTSQGLYIVDTKLGPFVPPGFGGRVTSVVRFINTTSSPVTFFPQAESPIVVPPGFIATLAGSLLNTGGADSGDGGLATEARFFGLSDVAVDANGYIYLTEVAGGVVRRINAETGVVTSLSLGAGIFTGVGGGPDGRIFVVDAMGGRLLRQNSPGGSAFTQLAAGLGSPRDVAIDIDGIAIVTNASAHRILSVAPNGTVSTLAGTTQGFSGDGGAATAAQLNISPAAVSIGTGAANQLLQTVGVAVTQTREIFFADVNNHRIRRLGPDVITCTRTGTISVNNPVPTLTSISPNSGFTGGAAFVLNLTGTNFVPNSVVRWQGNSRPTTFVSSTNITAAIPESDLTAPATVAVTVFNPSPGGGQTAPLNFAIANPQPAISGLNPQGVLAGSPALVLEIEGSNFIASSVVRWNGAPRSTTVISSTLLSTPVLQADLATAGTVNITVVTPAPGGGTSNTRIFSINNPVPTVASTSPISAQGGGPAFNLTVNGANFVSGSIVRFNGEDRPTTFVSGAELQAQVSPANIAAGGDKSVVVFNPSPGGGASNTASFQVTNPVPSIATLLPATAVAGSNAFLMTVSGTSLTPTSVVRWNGASRPTTFIDSTTVTATIPATDLVNPGSAEVTVLNPAPGGGTSNVLTFTVTNPVPVLTSVNPDRIVAGSADILVTLNGTKFVSNSQARWNGEPRTTTFVNATEIRMVILAADIANVGQGSITIFNPAPEGGVSSPLTFTIFPPNPSPGITSLSKTIEIAGSAAFMLTVQGTNFISSTVVQWNGNARPTTVVSATQLVASISAADIQHAGIAQVSVSTPAPGGGTTNPLAFTIAGALINVSAASFALGPVAPGSLVAGFGGGLAVGTASASVVPLPTLLIGTYIQIRDSSGASRQAELLFVSPGQVNYLIPAPTALGEATIDVTSGDGRLSRGTVTIAAVALSIFSANSDGKGVAAANAVRVVGSTVTFEDVAQLGEMGFIPKCINLGPPSESVFLALYGTGVQAAGPGVTVTATVGGIAVPVTFVGPQGSFVGLDQINIGPIPRQLIGAKVVNVVLLVNGVAANTVQVCID